MAPARLLIKELCATQSACVSFVLSVLGFDVIFYNVQVTQLLWMVMQLTSETLFSCERLSTAWTFVNPRDCDFRWRRSRRGCRWDWLGRLSVVEWAHECVGHWIPKSVCPFSCAEDAGRRGEVILWSNSGLHCCMPLGILKFTWGMWDANTVLRWKEVRCLSAYQGARSIVSDVGWCDTNLSEGILFGTLQTIRSVSGSHWGMNWEGPSDQGYNHWRNIFQATYESRWSDSLALEVIGRLVAIEGMRYEWLAIVTMNSDPGPSAPLWTG